MPDPGVGPEKSDEPKARYDKAASLGAAGGRWDLTLHRTQKGFCVPTMMGVSFKRPRVIPPGQ